MKEVGTWWESPNTGATNSSGLLPFQRATAPAEVDCSVDLANTVTGGQSIGDIIVDLAVS